MPGERRRLAARDPAAPAPRETVKWTDADFAAAGEGRLPMGKALEEWSYGDLDAGFAAAALVLDETFVVQSTGHHPMETRSAMAYWQNGKLFIHASTQSVAQTRGNIARWVGIEPSRGDADLRVHRRRIRQQGRRRRLDVDSGAAVAEGERAGDDADHPRGRKLHRPRAHQHDRSCPGRLCQGRPHHRARPLHRRRTPARTGRSAIIGRPASRRRSSISRRPCAGAR